MACTSIATAQPFSPNSKSLLDDIAASLKNFPDWRLRIVGHTDSTGDPQHNLRLSLDRATAIQELRGKLGDGVNQAADLISATVSIPSLNFIPLTTFGNWF